MPLIIEEVQADDDSIKHADGWQGRHLSSCCVFDSTTHCVFNVGVLYVVLAHDWRYVN
jgi:hypothetical protein